jgi:hypothetical protein
MTKLLSIGRGLRARTGGFCARADRFLERHKSAVRWSVIAYLVLLTGLAFSPIFFVEGAPYSPDSGHFLNQVNWMVEAFRGEISWRQAAINGYERTFIYQLPIGLVAALVRVYSPHFYLLLYWLFYVLPLPFLVWRLATLRAGKRDWYITLLPLVVFADPMLLRLATFGFFTEVPCITMVFASFVFSYELVTARTVRFASIKYALAALLLAAGLLSRLHTAIPIFFPAYGLYLLWAAWPLTGEKIKRLALLAGLCALAGILVIAIGKIWHPFLYAMNVAASFSTGFWKYGNSGVEMGLDYLYPRRFAYYGLGIPLSFAALFLVSLMHLPGSTRREKVLAGILAFLTLFQTLLWTLTLPINPRYLTGFAFFALIYIALKPMTSCVLRCLSGIVICTFALDGLYAHLPTSTFKQSPLMTFRQDGQAKLLGQRNGWNAPLYAHTKSRYAIPIRDIAAAMDGFQRTNDYRGLRFFALTPQDTFISDVGIRFWLLSHRLSDPHAFALQRAIQTSSYTPEFRVPELYANALGGNVSGLATADLVIAPMRGSSIPADDYKKRWFELAVLNELHNDAAAEKLGLKLLTNLHVFDRDQKMASVETIKLYEVKNGATWSAYVRKAACASPHANAITELCQEYEPTKITLGNLEADSMGKNILISKSKTGDAYALGVKLVVPDYRRFLEIYVHFMPNDRCPFRAIDFGSFFVENGAAWQNISRSEIDQIVACNYTIKVGARPVDIDADVFSAGAYNLEAHRKEIPEIFAANCPKQSSSQAQRSACRPAELPRLKMDETSWISAATQTTFNDEKFLLLKLASPRPKADVLYIHLSPRTGANATKCPFFVLDHPLLKNDTPDEQFDAVRLSAENWTRLRACEYTLRVGLGFKDGTQSWSSLPGKP